MSRSPSLHLPLQPYALPMRHVDDAGVITDARVLPFVPPALRVPLTLYAAGARVAASDAGAVLSERAWPRAEIAVAADADSEPTLSGDAVAEDAVSENTLSGDAVAEHVAADDALPWIDEFVVGEHEEGGERQLLKETGSDISSIAAELAKLPTSPVNAPRPSGLSNGRATETAEHAPWRDDEQWMDIMPVRPMPTKNSMEHDMSWARAFGELPAPLPPAKPPATDVLAAAAFLEGVARRLRAGDLRLAKFSADQGEAAALAAALAALLSS